MTMTTLPEATVSGDAVIRPAARADFPPIEALLAASHLPSIGASDLLDGFFVADNNGEIVGVVGLEHCARDYALLRSTAIASEWRGRSLGRRLVERAIEDAKRRGIVSLYLLTTTAERYFPQFGFVTTRRELVPAEVQATAEFRGACPASATVMSVTLAS